MLTECPVLGKTTVYRNSGTLKIAVPKNIERNGVQEGDVYKWRLDEGEIILEIDKS